MDDGSRISWLIVVLLLFGAMYFAMAETAFASVSRVALKTESDRGDTRAVKALRILDNFDRAITTILICTNIIHLAAAAIVTVQVTRIWGLSAVTLSTIITTIVVFFRRRDASEKHCPQVQPSPESWHGSHHSVFHDRTLALQLGSESDWRACAEDDKDVSGCCSNRG